MTKFLDELHINVKETKIIPLTLCKEDARMITMEYVRRVMIGPNRIIDKQGHLREFRRQKYVKIRNAEEWEKITYELLVMLINRYDLKD